MTSAKMRMITVITAEAMTAPLSPKILISAAVATADDVMFARLLPRSSAPIRRSGASRSLSAARARVLPRFSISFSLAREAAVRPVSAPEKKAATMIRRKMEIRA